MSFLSHLIRIERTKQNMSQEALAQGICAPSYLSKIENGKTQSSDEIYRLLFDRLDIHYIDDEKNLKKVKETIQEFYHNYAFLILPDAKELLELSEYLKRYYYSPFIIDVIIIRCLIAHRLGNKKEDEDLKQLIVFETTMDVEQRYWYYIALATYDRSMSGIDLLHRIEFQKEDGVVDMLLCNRYLFLGEQRKSHTYAQQAFIQAAKQGNVRLMAEAKFIDAFAYEQENDMVQMEKELKIVENLNYWIKDPVYDYSISYNIGASYIHRNQREKAKEYLNKAYKIYLKYGVALEGNPFYLYQKLILVEQEEHNIKKAKAYYEEMNPLLKQEYRSNLKEELAFMDYLLHHPDYQQDDQYITLLKACYKKAKNNNTYGFMVFYAMYLIKAYQRRRKYKEASNIMKELSFSDFDIE